MSGRPQRLTMTASEFNVLSTLVTRMKKMHEETHKGKPKKTNHILIKELQELIIKAKIKEGGLVAMPINRKHLRLIEEITTASLGTTKLVIENYQERQKNKALDPTAFDRHIMKLRHIEVQLLALRARIDELL
jgi:hypothetical protein